MLRVGCIPYLNCEPFFAHLSGVELVRLAPRAMGQAMARGELDAGPLSLVDYLRLQDRLTPLPFGIASPGPVRSVLLFSRRPPAELGGAVIGVTEETSTSVELLRILLAFKHKAAPRAWVGPDDPCDALLLIGDRAIRARTAGAGFPHVVDIASEWVEWTGLRCVFARWAIRAAVPEPERRAFERALGQALDRGMAALPELAARRRETGFTEAEVVAYLGGFVYRFGPEEDRAIAEFVRLLRKLEEERR